MTVVQSGAVPNAGPNRKQRRQAERKARKPRAGKGSAPETGKSQRLVEGKAHHVAGRLDRAEAIYRREIESGSQVPHAQALLGALCLQRGQAEQTVELLEQARRALPDQVPIHTNLGLAYDMLERTGDADRAFGRARDLQPEDPDAQKNVAGWLHSRHRFGEAIPLLERALAAAPRDPSRWLLLSKSYGTFSRLEPAIFSAERAFELAPEDPKVNAYLGMLLGSAGRYEEALAPLLAGFPAMGHDRDYQSTFLTVLSSVTIDSYRPDLERALLTCFETGLIDVQRLAPTAGGLLWLRYVNAARTEPGADGRGTKVHFDGVLADELLVLLLSRTVNQHQDLETLLVPLRRALLAQLRSAPEVSGTAMRFVAALAQQCHHNSYLFPLDEAETAEVQRLHAAVEQRLSEGEPTPDPELEKEIALCAMYRPLHRLQGFQRLLEVPLEAWSEELRPLLEVALHNPAREQALKATIPAFGTIDDQVSQKVRSQYEENPYPRWTFLPRHQPLSFAQVMRINAPWLTLPANFEEPEACLIAGCGTGRQPINIAAIVPQIPCLAIDLSLSSLAYAKRMAERHGVSNLEFMHGDLLDLGSLGRDFAWIESSGVLHHMEQPERGLESLLGVLRPGGYLKLGLYSRRARRFIVEARQRIRELGLEPTTENIREFRRRIAAGQEPHLDQYTKFSDFFDLDSFRDLVFHVQEHQFTIPELKAMLERHGLAFAGFVGLSEAVHQRFAAARPDPGAYSDLDRWAAFEEDAPDAFIGMYEFWCRKPT